LGPATQLGGYYATQHDRHPFGMVRVTILEFIGYLHKRAVFMLIERAQTALPAAPKSIFSISR
jgi:hypothetical protein